MSRVEVGVNYCRLHHGTLNEDDNRCDFFDPADPDQRCPNCNGDEGALDPDGEWHECLACDGWGVTPCDPVPLFYEEVTP